jgi:membrane-anchored protein YejM (alkaline phosphatase superfamily)
MIGDGKFGELVWIRSVYSLSFFFSVFVFFYPLQTAPLSASAPKREKAKLAEYLKSKGYSTGAFIGAFPLDSRFGLSQGFDVYDEAYPSKSSTALVFPERNAPQVIRSALNWLEKQDSQWFSFIHIWDPHAPYSPPEPFSNLFKDDPYSGEVAYVDSEIKKLFDGLESGRLLDDTLIVLTEDHGESLGEHGVTMHGYFAYNSTIWVPLILVGPSINAARVDEYVSRIDIFPTICDVIGIKKPSFSPWGFPSSGTGKEETFR